MSAPVPFGASAPAEAKPPPPALEWPANQPGLMCFFDPFSDRAFKTYEGLMRNTQSTLPTTRWVHEASHVLVDIFPYPNGLPAFLREAYKGKVVVSLDWARDSYFEEKALDVEDERYRVKWAGEDPKGKKRERENDVEEDARPQPKKKSSVDVLLPAPALAAAASRGTWTDEENMSYARYMVENPNPNWNTYQQMHPHRSLNSYQQHHYHATDKINRLIVQIKRERGDQASVAPARVHRPAVLERSDDDNQNSPAAVRRPAPAATPKICHNCGSTNANMYHHLTELKTPEHWYCASCRGVYYPTCKTNLEAAKRKLAERRERVLAEKAANSRPPSSSQAQAPPTGNRFVPHPLLGSDSGDDSDEPLSAGGNNKRQSLPFGSRPNSSASNSHRISLPGPGPSSSTNAAPPPRPAPHSHSSWKKPDDFDPRLEKRRQKQEKLGATPPQPRPAFHSHASSSSSHQPAPPPPSQPIWSRIPHSQPTSNRFLSVGVPPEGHKGDAWCHACGSASSDRYARVNLRYAGGEGKMGVKYVARVLCKVCNDWWKLRKEGKSEGQKVELTRGLEERGREVRRGVVEGR